MTKAENLEKGDEFWGVLTEKYHQVLEVPVLVHGVVGGGGEYQIIVKWDRVDRPTRENRHRFQKRVYRSPAEAIDAGIARLESIRAEAEKRASLATGGIWSLKQQKRQLDGDESE